MIISIFIVSYKRASKPVTFLNHESMKTIKPHFTRTILGIAIMGFLLIFYSCSQETVLDPVEDLKAVNAKSKKGKEATRAWRGKFSNVANLDQPTISCAPVEAEVVLTTNTISGNMTHLGKIQPGSFGRPQEGTCALTSENTLNVIYYVNYIGAHGDMITTEEAVTIIIDFDADPLGRVGSFENTKDADGNVIPIKILEGTGRFEGATGELLFKDAVFGPNVDGTIVSTWELVGTITY